MNMETLFSHHPYQLESGRKQEVLGQILNELTDKHRRHCAEYRRLLDSFPGQRSGPLPLDQIPLLPVRLFKLHELRSVPRESVIKTLTSSGTTSQVVSRIFLDKETSVLMTKALVSIMTSFLGKQRYPMILVDSPGVIKDRSTFSARGAGLLGLTFMGRDHFYLLDEEMNVKWEELYAFLSRHQGEKILFFGFTYMVWKYFYLPCVEKGVRLDLQGSFLIHSGGWKKLTELAVDNPTFKTRLREQLGIAHVHNFYGMVEQVGSVFMECEEGHLHAPDFADLIVRDPMTLKPLPFGKPGLVHVLSLLPQSYPGHSLLTEDVGTILGEDDCACGRKGKYFAIHGRLPAAELRGCSDTHAFGQVSQT
jgi:hypothetical protein